MAVRKITYGMADLRDFTITTIEDKTNKVLGMNVEGVTVAPSPRFWGSLCSTFSTHGLSMKLFKLFDHPEVFNRLYDRIGGSGKTRLGYAIEEMEDGKKTLLAIRNPNAPLIEYEPAQELLKQYVSVDARNAANGKVGLSYSGGVIQSWHSPPNTDAIKLGDEVFECQYVTETPIDGFGKPVNYLSLVRRVCSNGAVFYTRAFRSEINTGKADDNALLALERCIQTFNNEEGFAAIRDRIDVARHSWASIHECNTAYELLHRLAKNGVLCMPDHKTSISSLANQRAMAKGLDEDNTHANIVLNRAYLELTGDIAYTYDIGSISTLSVRRRQVMPVKCTVYDLINFVTEIATHYTVNAREALPLHAFIGSLITEDYDLENSCTMHSNFREFFTEINGQTPTLGDHEAE